MQNVESACFLWALCMSSFSLEVFFTTRSVLYVAIGKNPFPTSLCNGIVSFKKFYFSHPTNLTCYVYNGGH